MWPTNPIVGGFALLFLIVLTACTVVWVVDNWLKDGEPQPREVRAYDRAGWTGGICHWRVTGTVGSIEGYGRYKWLAMLRYRLKLRELRRADRVIAAAENRHL